ncbi:16S rRNA m(2)G-966 methyltransferase [Sinobacterium caligoides]|uniref:Ribosomal RNA small subunit methyltransferase D n=1 Tax=Sinobacterium caligoides TaxID=933926 RepID=A0A3N2DGM1_9GAMM|nr:16S rRNA (guanine(966)-N(2))-methyltransferase RsmD [Sinobacterium caligoides]ROR98946.1 16S rRNA m(2)G-966 methyltransferase [Sinobacterium caligoides]
MTNKRHPSKPRPTNKRSANSLRIIGGRWRGRKLTFADSDGLRPTGDRIRETLFNWLQGDIAGARCLDLFSGAGALGFEAASRGAAIVTMIEYSAPVATQLRQNEQLLKSDNTQVIHDDALRWLQHELANSNELDYNIILLDPPFAGELLQESLDALAQPAKLKINTLIYLEMEKSSNFQVPAHWQQLKAKTAGQVSYYLYQNNAKPVNN